MHPTKKAQRASAMMMTMVMILAAEMRMLLGIAEEAVRE
jgi:hypothetical protein